MVLIEFQRNLPFRKQGDNEHYHRIERQGIQKGDTYNNQKFSGYQVLTPLFRMDYVPDMPESKAVLFGPFLKFCFIGFHHRRRLFDPYQDRSIVAHVDDSVFMRVHHVNRPSLFISRVYQFSGLLRYTPVHQP
jgi:hypothetical protein